MTEAFWFLLGFLACPCSLFLVGGALIWLRIIFETFDDFAG